MFRKQQNQELENILRDQKLNFARIVVEKKPGKFYFPTKVVEEKNGAYLERELDKSSLTGRYEREHKENKRKVYDAVKKYLQQSPLVMSGDLYEIIYKLCKEEKQKVRENTKYGEPYTDQKFVIVDPSEPDIFRMINYTTDFGLLARPYLGGHGANTGNSLLINPKDFFTITNTEAIEQAVLDLYIKYPLKIERYRNSRGSRDKFPGDLKRLISFDNHSQISSKNLKIANTHNYIYYVDEKIMKNAVLDRLMTDTNLKEKLPLMKQKTQDMKKIINFLRTGQGI